jgi:hypothetical protein
MGVRLLSTIIAVLLLVSLWATLVFGSASARPQPSSNLLNSSPSIVTADCTAQWETVTGPQKGQNNSYFALQFAGPYDGWAVGSYSPVTDGPTRTLINRWDGFAWKNIPGVDPADSWNQLTALSVLSSTDVWAAGTSGPGYADYKQELVIHWDGQSWTQHSTPNSESASNHLTDIVAVAPDNVWAVGYYYISGYRPYALHWDGSKWSHVDMPMLGGRLHFPQRVVAVSANDIWTVGYISAAFSTETQYNTLIEHWDGSTWDLVPSPNPGGYDSILFGVSVIPNGKGLWATGRYNDAKGEAYKTFITRWDGTAWNVVPSPNAGAGDNDLQNVVAVADNNAWAVGSYQASVGAKKQILILHWDGNAWSVVSLPSQVSVSDSDDTLASVAIGGNTLWVAGQSVNTKGTNTLLGAYGRNCLAPAPTATPTGTPTKTPTVTPTVTVTSTPTKRVTSTPVTTTSGSPAGTHVKPAGDNTFSMLLGFALGAFLSATIMLVVFIVLLFSGRIAINSASPRDRASPNK